MADRQVSGKAPQRLLFETKTISRSWPENGSIRKQSEKGKSKQKSEEAQRHRLKRNAGALCGWG